MKNKHGDDCRLSVHIKSEQTICVQSVACKCVSGYIIRTSLSVLSFVCHCFDWSEKYD